MKRLKTQNPKVTLTAFILCIFLLALPVMLNNTLINENLNRKHPISDNSQSIVEMPSVQSETPSILNASLTLNQTSYVSDSIVNVTISLNNNYTEPLTEIDFNTTLDPYLSVYSGNLNASRFELGVNETYSHSFLLEVLEGGSSLDVAFLIDGSGSMGEELGTVKSELQNLITELSDQVSVLRVAFIFFGSNLYFEGPYGDSRNILDFTKVQSEITDFLSPFSADGSWEPWGDALHYLQNLDWQSSAKLGILVTDEPCNYGDYIPDNAPQSTQTYDGDQLYDLVEDLSEQGIIVSTMECAGASSIAKEQLQKIAEIGGGIYTQLSSSASELIDSAILMCEDVIGEYGLKIESLINCSLGATSLQSILNKWVIIDDLAPSLNIDVVPVINSVDGRYKQYYRLNCRVLDISGVNNLTLFYRHNTSTFLETPMEKIGSDKYTFLFPYLEEETTLIYYLFASDGLNNSIQTDQVSFVITFTITELKIGSYHTINLNVNESMLFEFEISDPQNFGLVFISTLPIGIEMTTYEDTRTDYEYDLNHSNPFVYQEFLEFQGEGNLIISNKAEYDTASVQLYCINVNEMDMPTNISRSVNVTFSTANPVYLIKTTLDHEIHPFITCFTHAQSEYQVFRVIFFNTTDHIKSSYSSLLSSQYSESGVHYFLIILEDQRLDAIEVNVTLEYKETIDDGYWPDSGDSFGGEAIPSYAPFYLFVSGLISIVWISKKSKKQLKSTQKLK